MLYQNMEVQITVLNMSSAFDTIEREELLQILELILEEDEIRMCRLLLSEKSKQVIILHKLAHRVTFVLSLDLEYFSPRGHF